MVENTRINAAAYYTLKETAEYFRCSVDTVRRLIKANKLQAISLGGEGKGVRVSVESIRKFEENDKRPIETK
jgi:excisionase family DNA binding protein